MLPSCRLEFKQFQDCIGSLIFHNNDSSWWIKIAMDGSLPEQIVGLGFLKRQYLFREFIEAIDFAKLQLLNDTVTHIMLSLTEQSQNSITIKNGYQNSENFFISNAHRMCCNVTEDPMRTIYPTLEQARCLPTFEATSLQTVEDIYPTVDTVLFKQDMFVYKKIHRPLYIPDDTDNVLKEIDVLAELRGLPNFAQLVGLVVSENPYKTFPSTDMPTVITGFLLEYCPGGSLEKVLEDEVQFGALPLQWALQIGSALELLHSRGRAHLDIKPANIVLDANKNAVLIDVSETGGYGWEWLSPEMETLKLQDSVSAFDAPFETRVGTDCWAYGKVLSAIATKCGTSETTEKLRLIADCLTKVAPESRISLSEALVQLSERSCSRPQEAEPSKLEMRTSNVFFI